MSKIKVNFIVDNKPLYSKKVEPTEKLSDIRKKFGIEEEYFFQTNDGFNILKDDEIDYNVEDSLIDNNKIILKKEVQKKKANVPIEGSKLLKCKFNTPLLIIFLEIHGEGN
jgi:hypothetical protein